MTDKYMMRDQGKIPLKRTRITFQIELEDDAHNPRPDQDHAEFWPSAHEGDDNYCPPEHFKDSYAEAARRMRAWENGEWCYIGVRARAVIEIPVGESIVTYQLISPGTWGVPSDEAPTYLQSLFREQVEEMVLHITTLTGGYDMAIKK